MAGKKRMNFKRRRENKTDYKKRLQLLSSSKPRLVVRITNKRIIAHVVSFDFKGDKTLASADSKDLKAFGFDYGKRGAKNSTAAYLVGLLCGKRAVAAGHKEAILDMGLKSPTKGNKAFATLKGAVDAGLNIPHGNETTPPEQRIAGKNPQVFAAVKEKILTTKVEKVKEKPVEKTKAEPEEGKQTKTTKQKK